MDTSQIGFHCTTRGAPNLLHFKPFHGSSFLGVAILSYHVILLKEINVYFSLGLLVMNSESFLPYNS